MQQACHSAGGGGGAGDRRIISLRPAWRSSVPPGLKMKKATRGQRMETLVARCLSSINKAVSCSLSNIKKKKKKPEPSNHFLPQL